VVLTGVFQPGLTVVVLSLVLIQWAAFARVVRAQTLSIRERDFVKASRILGRSSGYIMWRHVLPNVLGPVLVMLSYFAPVVIITEAGLSFIGLGAQPPTPSLGQMLADGQNYFTADQWMIVLPALVLAVIAMGLNTFGDALRDALDPQGL
jgi:peptide/nickel transport system permease protein